MTTYLSIEETIKLWKSDKAHDVVRDGLPTSAERRRRGGEVPANALADVNIRGDVMRGDPSAAGWSVTLSALVWLVWYRMGVTRGGHAYGGVHDVYASAGTAAVAWCG